MLPRSFDLRDDNLVEIRAALLDPLDFDATHREQFRQLVDVRRQLYEFPQPVNGEFHVWGAHAASRAAAGGLASGSLAAD